MKQLIYIFSMAVALLLGTASCEREHLNYDDPTEEQPTVDEPQTVDLRLRSLLQVEVLPESTGEATTRSNAVDVNAFTVQLFKEDHTKVNQWVYGTMPELVSVLQGKYYVKVLSHIEAPVDTKPYYEGTSEVFTVKPSAITEVNKITCSMKSIKAVITFDASLIPYLGNDIRITISLGSASYVHTDLSAAAPVVYFAAATASDNVITVRFEGTVDGVKEDFTRTYTANEGEYLKIQFTLKNVGEGEIVSSGNANLKLTLDLKVTVIRQNSNITTEEEVIPEDKPDDEEGGEVDETVPTIKGRGFDIKVAQNVNKEGQLENVSGGNCIVDITAPMRFAHLYVKISSEKLTPDVLESVGLVSEFDLAYPGDLATKLGKNEDGTGLGFPIGDQVIGQKTLVFDITGFTPLLNIYGAATHRFIITAVDQDGTEVSETLTLITK